MSLPTGGGPAREISTRDWIRAFAFIVLLIAAVVGIPLLVVVALDPCACTTPATPAYRLATVAV